MKPKPIDFVAYQPGYDDEVPYQWFLRFIALTPSKTTQCRDLRKLVFPGKSAIDLPTLEKWARRYLWFQRAQWFDLHRGAVAAPDMHDASPTEVAQAALNLANAQFALMTRMASGGAMLDTKLADASTRMMKEAGKLLDRAQALELLQQSNEDIEAQLAQLTPEELLQLSQLRRRVAGELAEPVVEPAPKPVAIEATIVEPEPAPAPAPAPEHWPSQLPALDHEALALIARCDDPDVLRRWAVATSDWRTDVLGACIAKHDALVGAPAAPAPAPTPAPEPAPAAPSAAERAQAALDRAATMQRPMFPAEQQALGVYQQIAHGSPVPLPSGAPEPDEIPERFKHPWSRGKRG